MVTMWRYIIFISIINHFAVADIITYISGGYYNASSPCLSALIHFNTTNSNGSSFYLSSSFPITFTTSDCIIFNNVGVCYVSVQRRFADGHKHKFQITKKFKNGTQVEFSRDLMVNFVDIFGPLLNVSIIPVQNGIKIMWSTGINKCIEPNTHVSYVQYVICTFDAHRKAFTCKPPRKISITNHPEKMICIRKDFRMFNCFWVVQENVRENVTYKIKIRYTFGYNENYSKWSKYSFYNSENLDVPTLECSFENKWTVLKWNVHIPEVYLSGRYYVLYIYSDGVFLEKKTIPADGKKVYHYRGVYEELSFKMKVCAAGGICSLLSKSCRPVVTDTQIGDSSEKTVYIIIAILIALITIAFTVIAVAYIRQKRRSQRFIVSESRVDLQEVDNTVDISPYSTFTPQ
ncbi:uncharacterized protein LOC130629282 [Hydractinia symbiolongicarpus]|uniref:uncharacterized protein LOC130629282 n=1 Tax=Hydractinia symbiolongicarpus TaxID=13093 RepID=UPI00254EB358|nr:uncharacterized protein LOC130629282 [Hydractinia symbiolongicarpus]